MRILDGPEALGRRVAKHRAGLGWTQNALAERIAVSRVALSHLEAGLSCPNERTVALLAGVFGVEAHELVAGTDYPGAKTERLPLVVARHTEVDHELALLGADLAWAERLAALPALAGLLDDMLDGVLASWRPRLEALEVACADPGERRRVRHAARSLRRS